MQMLFCTVGVDHTTDLKIAAVFAEVSEVQDVGDGEPAGLQ